MVLIGAFAVMLTPREEEPQIVVPMIDVMVMLPGADPAEVENLVTKPLERKIWEIEGVEYVYASQLPELRPGDRPLPRRHRHGSGRHADLEQGGSATWTRRRPGILQPLVKVRAIDDVPMLTLTLWSDTYDAYGLRQIAGELMTEVAAVENVSVVQSHGGRRRTVQVALDPQRMTAMGVTTLSVLPAIQMQNQSLPAGSFAAADQQFMVETGDFLRIADEVASLVVGVFGGRPVRLSDVATITDGPDEIDSYAFFGTGRAGAARASARSDPRRPRPASTPRSPCRIAKRKGSDATRVSRAVLQKVEDLQGPPHPGRRARDRDPRLRQDRQREGHAPDREPGDRDPAGDARGLPRPWAGAGRPSSSCRSRPPSR